MSEGQDEGAEKSFEPTPEKLKKAKKQGQIAKSNDLITAGTYLGMLVVMLGFGGGLLINIGTILEVLLDQAVELSDLMAAGSGRPMIGGVVSAVLPNALPWVVVPMVVALLVILGQQAMVVTPSNLAPKMSRISILSNAKNKFGRSGWFEFFKNTAKLLLYCIVLGVYLSRNTDRIIATMALSPGQVASEMTDMVVGLMTLVLVIAISLGIVDFTWQKAEHIRKNRMTLKELKDEMKESEGDPEMKGKRRQKGQEIALNQMLADVPDAAVVIVNPTHYAVALSWDRNGVQAPICVAKGVDEVAARIREVASEADVPIHSDPPTARALHAAVEIGDEIQPDHFMAVAAAIRFADDMRRKARAR